MHIDDKMNLTDQISTATIEQLRDIISRLESMPPSPDVLEFIDMAEDNLLSLSGQYGDW